MQQRVKDMQRQTPVVPLFKGIPSASELGNSERSARPLVLGVPLAASPSYRKCQLDCGYCFVEREERGAFLTLRDHFDVIDRFAEAGGRYVRTATVGEPFLDRMFFNPEGVPGSLDPERSRFPLIDHALGRGMFWTSFSNLLDVDESVAEELGTRDVSLIGKLHAMEPSVQESMTGNTGHYASRQWATVGGRRVPRSLKLLMDAGLNRSRPGDPPGTTRLAVDIVATRVNYRHIPAVVRFCLEHDIYPFLEMLELFGTAVDTANTYLLSPMELEWLHKELCELLGEEFFSKETRARTNCFCPAFTAGLIYNPDGRVRYCYCANSTSTRNVRTDDLLDLYTELGAQRRAIRAEIEALENGDSKSTVLAPCPIGSYARPVIGRLGGETWGFSQ